MEKNRIAGETSYADRIKRLLTQKCIAYSSRKIPYRHLCIFDMVSSLDMLWCIEQRITMYVYEKRICVYAAVPVMSVDKDETASIINTLNIENTIGIFRFDSVSGMMEWTDSFMDRQGKWPGDACILAVLCTAKDMIEKLCTRLQRLEG